MDIFLYKMYLRMMQEDETQVKAIDQYTSFKTCLVYSEYFPFDATRRGNTRSCSIFLANCNGSDPFEVGFCRRVLNKFLNILPVVVTCWNNLSLDQ